MLNRFRFARLLQTFVIVLLLGSGLISQTGFAQSGTRLFITQSGTPVAIQNFVHLEKGCNWSGIGGQVFGLDGTPLTGLVIKLSGKLEGQEILYYAITGGSVQFGPGGYLIELADHAVASKNTAMLQVLEITGEQKTSQIPITTYADCTKNLLLVNIVEIELKNPVYFPSIRK